MRNINRNMLHMKLNSAVSVFAVTAAFSVLLPSPAYSGICFLPDCQDDEVVQGDINMNINSDTEYCEKEGYTYYASGECPQYYAKIKRMENITKFDLMIMKMFLKSTANPYQRPKSKNLQPGGIKKPALTG